MIQNLTDLEVNISGKILLECKVSGTPEPQVTWRKNGYPISAASGGSCSPEPRGMWVRDWQGHHDTGPATVPMTRGIHTQIQGCQSTAGVSSLEFEVRGSSCVQSQPSTHQHSTGKSGSAARAACVRAEFGYKTEPRLYLLLGWVWQHRPELSALLFLIFCCPKLPLACLPPQGLPWRCIRP